MYARQPGHILGPLYEVQSPLLQIVHDLSIRQTLSHVFHQYTKNHRLLISLLRTSFDITGFVLAWLQSYVSNRIG